MAGVAVALLALAWRGVAEAASTASRDGLPWPDEEDALGLASGLASGLGDPDLEGSSTTLDPLEDYDYTEALSSYDWYEIVPTLVVYILTMVLGLAGNALIIFTTQRYRRMQSTTNVFLSSLASADLLLIIVCIPVKVSRECILLIFSTCRWFYI